MIPVLLIAIKTPLERKTAGLEKHIHIFLTGGDLWCVDGKGGAVFSHLQGKGKEMDFGKEIC